MRDRESRNNEIAYRNLPRIRRIERCIFTETLEMDQALYTRICDRYCINETTGCWEWQGCCNGSGYPEITYQGRSYMVHRTMYEMRWGPLAPTQHAHHTCHRRHCINPDHLQGVTARENIARQLAISVRRDERLRLLVERYADDLHAPGMTMASSDLATLWGCRSNHIPRLLETMALLDDRFHIKTIRRKRGPSPALFRIWLDIDLLEELTQMTELSHPALSVV